MKFSVSAGAFAILFSLAACGPGPKSDAAADAPAAQPSAAAPTEAPAAPSVSADSLPGAPAYADLYPGAEVEGTPTLAEGPAGDGGMVVFQTSADPDAVIAFYRQRAEAAGLDSIMSMNQGDARAYGASSPGDTGANLRVVASPGDDQKTSVQLSWSAGA